MSYPRKKTTALLFLCVALFVVSSCELANRSNVDQDGKSMQRNVELILLAKYLDDHDLGGVIMLEYDSDNDTYKVTTNTSRMKVGPLTGGGFLLIFQIKNGALVELDRKNWVS